MRAIVTLHYADELIGYRAPPGFYEYAPAGAAYRDAQLAISCGARGADPAVYATVILP